MKAVQASGHLARLPTLPRFQGPPGWSFNATYFHATLGGGSNVATADVLPLFPRTTLRVQLDFYIKTNVDIAIRTPAYTLATPVWGGRLDFKLFIPVGGARTQIDALVTGALGTDWLLHSEQHQRYAQLIRRSGAAAFIEME